MLCGHRRGRGGSGSAAGRENQGKNRDGPGPAASYENVIGVHEYPSVCLTASATTTSVLPPTKRARWRLSEAISGEESAMEVAVSRWWLLLGWLCAGGICGPAAAQGVQGSLVDLMNSGRFEFNRLE